MPDEVRFDLIWSNPPIRIGKAALRRPAAHLAAAVARGGARAYLVVAKQLGADSLQRWLAQTFPAYAVDRYATEKGFRVLRISLRE